MTTAPETYIDLVAIHRALTPGAHVPHLERHELAYAVHLLTADGCSAREISKRLGVTSRTVTRWRARPSTLGTFHDEAGAPTDWQAYARCAETDAALFFPEDDERGHVISYAQARSVCGSCEVRAECLDDAMTREGDRSERHRNGLWGGLSPGQRAALAAARRKEATA